MNERDKILLIVKVVVIFNAITTGWDVKQITDKSFELTKKNYDEFNFNTFMETITADIVC
ncbi:MAG: hypothetical protein Faunusvirus27_4 [Faunusvirus sp.]|uniref:Uncharacterized protein n=1 Tax=Faunusvirus sp. TaxID=2487766 RepID=A0A3G5A169_9VIRU|nr:MAG: hypothetical protein Faunusvirus27_4 [Faunusvirus sp.]